VCVAGCVSRIVLVPFGQNNTDKNVSGNTLGIIRPQKNTKKNPKKNICRVFSCSTCGILQRGPTDMWSHGPFLFRHLCFGPAVDRHSFVFQLNTQHTLAQVVDIFAAFSRVGRILRHTVTGLRPAASYREFSNSLCSETFATYRLLDLYSFTNDVMLVRIYVASSARNKKTFRPWRTAPADTRAARDHQVSKFNPQVGF
jgi:hypothetical protein